MRLLVIAGHGGKDSGAVNEKYGEKEANLVRDLCGKMAEYGDIIYVNNDYDVYSSKAISELMYKYDPEEILEVHMDSAANDTAKGGHVIINSRYEPDEIDIRLSNVMKDYFSGRSTLISKRGDLYNCNVCANKKYSYRLIECGFVTNSRDLFYFKNNIDNLAKDILKCFNLNTKEKLYRVQIGAFRNKDNAVVLKEKLKELGFDDVFISEG